MKTKLTKALPNIITISRIVALILGFIFFMRDNFLISIIFYIYGAVSDAFDGYFARKFDAYSKLGQYLDGISDKLYLLSIIIISIIHKNYLIIIPLVLEVIISIINYQIIKVRKRVYTERIGKIKMNVEIVTMLIALLSIKYHALYYIFVVLLILTVYFQVQCIIAYINQKNNKSKEVVVNFKGKKIIERIKLLLEEFFHYLIHPIKIIK